MLNTNVIVSNEWYIYIFQFNTLNQHINDHTYHNYFSTFVFGLLYMAEEKEDIG